MDTSRKRVSLSAGLPPPSAREESSVIDDQLDVPLEDAELLAEVELTTNLIIAATESDASLSQQQIDDLLGIASPVPRQHLRKEA